MPDLSPEHTFKRKKYPGLCIPDAEIPISDKKVSESFIFHSLCTRDVLQKASKLKRHSGNLNDLSHSPTQFFSL